MSPTELLDRVCDRDSFFAFVSALINDRKSAPETWEWDSIEDFLGASLR